MDSAAFWDAYHRGIPQTDWYCGDPGQALRDVLEAIAAAGWVGGPLTSAVHVGCGSSSLGDLLEDGGAGGALSEASGAARALLPRPGLRRVLK